MVDRRLLIRYAAATFSGITLVTTFVGMYADNSPLVSHREPRICEFSYTKSFDTDTQMTLIPVCLAMQVTDIFAQVFFVAGLGAGITGVFQRGLEPERTDKWSEKLPVFVGLCFIASLISVFGRATFSHIAETGGAFTARMSNLDFDKTMFLMVFWINCANLAVVALLLVYMFYLVNTGLAGNLGSYMGRPKSEPAVATKSQVVKLKTSEDGFFGL